MTISAAEMLVNGILLYFGVGLVIALIYSVVIMPRLDWAAKGSGVIFRIMTLPGLILLWPIILIRIVSMKVINRPIHDDAMTGGDHS